MNVREVMKSGNLLTVLESDTLAAAAHKMAWGTCRHLPVVRDGQVIGMLSERDVLAWLGEGHRLDGPSDLVRAAMVAPAIVAVPEEDIGEAAARMIFRRIVLSASNPLVPPILPTVSLRSADERQSMRPRALAHLRALRDR